ncbi:hypothetical protein BDD12DRAFT_302580 [Trichophaea hybrida]|nr:hypothetical protein BDD12DRAFT_302580 [Trichophaea hybrida]
MRSLLPIASLAIFSLFSHSLAQGKQTTIVGPTSFCQGLSPGGNSCITVSRGCYIIAPTDNVVPSVHCTATPSSTTVRHHTTTTHPNPSSTGRATTKETSKKKTATTTGHTKTTTTHHTETTTTKPTKTTATPTTTATTNPSTDLKEASQEAKAAQTAVKKYQQDPTNKSLAQAAEKAINKAKTKSKHAVNSAKNSSLEKFAKDLFDSLDNACTYPPSYRLLEESDR